MLGAEAKSERRSPAKLILARSLRRQRSGRSYRLRTYPPKLWTVPIQTGDRADIPAARRGDREAVRHGRWVQGAAAAMGGRTDVRMAQPLSPSLQGFRESDKQRAGFYSPCVDPTHATKGL
jgi:hypothetical protein